MINKIRIKKGSILVVEALSKYSSDNIAPEMLGKFVGVIKENIKDSAIDLSVLAIPDCFELTIIEEE